MKSADFLIIGGGIAGLSAASRLAAHGRVAVLEGEEALGYHSSGRSVTFSHFGIGNAAVRGLTAYSRAFFENPPEGFRSSPLYRGQSSVYLATEAMLGELDALQAEMARFTDKISWVDEAEIRALCPVLRTGAEGFVSGVLDISGLRLDADALLQSFARSVRGQGGEVLTGQRIASIEREGQDWRVRTETGEEWSAPFLVNAAGAWSDAIAGLAGVAPLGLQPMRRTIIVVDPPEGADASDWPFVHTAASDFYMLPEAGRLLVSPVDEIPSDPCDAWPEEYDIAVAAAKLEEYTTISVRRIAHSWAGLRSFVADRVPTAGFAPDAPGFFWLAGQGGYGLQTAPAMAEIVEALATGGEWPAGLVALGVTRDHIEPDRLFAATA
ncbi:MAG TPA: FAD-binding oxidoreductase [Allosphingosinicella sp.]|nr:FAD-binding oxidoreductase [Allosphingosinicella sp.]